MDQRFPKQAYWSTWIFFAGIAVVVLLRCPSCVRRLRSKENDSTVDEPCHSNDDADRRGHHADDLQGKCVGHFKRGGI